MRPRPARAAVALLLLTVAGAAGRAADRDQPADREKQQDAEARRLRGRWQATEGVRDGKALAKDELAKITLAFRGPQDGRLYAFTDLRPLIADEAAESASFRLHPWEEPPQFDIDRPHGGRVSRYPGVYELDGDTFRICVDLRFSPDGPPDRKRPTEFAAPEGSGLTLLMLKRVKDK